MVSTFRGLMMGVKVLAGFRLSRLDLNQWDVGSILALFERLGKFVHETDGSLPRVRWRAGSADRPFGIFRSRAIGVKCHRLEEKSVFLLSSKIRQLPWICCEVVEFPFCIRPI